MSTPLSGYEYKVGGGLDSKAPSYVIRRADQEFYAALKAGKFCYVFNSRQMGKTSLQNRTVQRLRAEGIACGTVALTQIGTHNLTDAGWYQGILGRLKSSLGIKFRYLDWWFEREDIPPLQRFVEFIETVLLVEISQPIVLFFDEIDSVFRFDFKDDFFALIRTFDEQRAEQPEYKRLTFALLGVATPSDLIQDKSRTPFNIGQAIDLEGFQPQEVHPLIPGLVSQVENPEAVLSVVLSWTGGQPFLTQKLCQLIRQSAVQITAGNEEQSIEQLVRSRLLENWESQDNPEHLRTIRDRLLRSGERRRGRLLGLYQQILPRGEVLADDTSEQMELRLTGLVVKRQGKLRVYNPIYAAVFNSIWLEAALAQLRPYAQNLREWEESGRQDESRLLRGQALREAQTWATGKSLGDQDYQFLRASEGVDRRTMQAALEAERQAKQVLATAQRQATRISTISAIAFIGSLIFAIVASVFAGQENQRASHESNRASHESQRASEAQQSVKTANAKLKQTQEEEQKALQKLQTSQQAHKEAQTAEDATQVAQQKQSAAEQKVATATQELETAQLKTARAQQQQQQAEASAERAQQGDQLERKGTALLRHSPVQFASIENLVSAIELGQELKEQLKGTPARSDILSLKDYPATSPVLALRKAVHQVLAKNTVAGFNPRFSPNGQLLLTDSVDGKSTLYNLSGHQLVQVAGSNPSFSSNGQLLLTSSLNDKITLYDLKGKQLAQVVGSLRSFSPNGQLLLTDSVGGKSTLYDLKGKQLVQVAGSNPIFSPNGQLLLTDSDEDIIRLYNLSGNLLAEFPGSNPTLSPDGHYLLTFDSNYTGYLWRVDNGLDDLLAQGCQWLQAYLSSHPEEQKRLKICHR